MKLIKKENVGLHKFTFVASDDEIKTIMFHLSIVTRYRMKEMLSKHDELEALKKHIEATKNINIDDLYKVFENMLSYKQS